MEFIEDFRMMLNKVWRNFYDKSSINRQVEFCMNLLYMFRRKCSKIYAKIYSSFTSDDYCDGVPRLTRGIFCDTLIHSIVLFLYCLHC